MDLIYLDPPFNSNSTNQPVAPTFRSARAGARLQPTAKPSAHLKVGATAGGWAQSSNNDGENGATLRR